MTTDNFFSFFKLYIRKNIMIVQTKNQLLHLKQKLLIHHNGQHNPKPCKPNLTSKRGSHLACTSTHAQTKSIHLYEFCIQVGRFTNYTYQVWSQKDCVCLEQMNSEIPQAHSPLAKECKKMFDWQIKNIRTERHGKQLIANEKLRQPKSFQFALPTTIYDDQHIQI